MSDLSSKSDPSLAAPVQLPHCPHNGAIVDGDGGKFVDVAINDFGIASVGWVGWVGVAGRNKDWAPGGWGGG